MVKKTKIDMLEDEFALWKNEKFIVTTLRNPHIPKSEGCHLVIRPLRELKRAWDDSKLCGEAFELASRISKVLIDEKIVDWTNLQNNQNWGLLPGGKLFFHVHIYGRKKSGKTWGQPVEIPKNPGTFKNEPMAERDIQKLITKFKEVL